MKEEQKMDVELQSRMESLRALPPRDPDRAAAGRRQYLAQMRTMKRESAAAVSGSVFGRLKGWLQQISQPPLRKERFVMLQAITAIVVVITMLFGGAGATVFAAQDSLPNEVLYPVKTWTEDLRLNAAANPDTRLELALDFAGRRIDEISTLVVNGETVPEEVIARLNADMFAAFEAAALMDAAEVDDALDEIGVHIRKHDRLMEELELRPAPPASGATNPLIARVRNMFANQLRLAGDALENPLQFRFRMNNPNPNVPGAVQETDGLTDTLDIDSAFVISGTQQMSGTMFGPGPQAGPGPDAGPGEPGIGPGEPGIGPGADGVHGDQAGPGGDAGIYGEGAPGPKAGPGQQFILPELITDTLIPGMQYGGRH